MFKNYKECEELLLETGFTQEQIDKLNKTAVVLSAMFNEEINKSCLDSGGYYGYKYNSNRANPPVYRDTAQIIDFDITGEPIISVNAFNYLAEGFDYIDEVHEALYRHMFNKENVDAYYTDIIENLIEKLEKEEVIREGYFSGLYGTNGEMFDQIINYTTFCLEKDYVLEGTTIPANWYTILMVHGGCDYRGGYTAPVIFEGHIEDAICNHALLTCKNCDFEVTTDGSGEIFPKLEGINIDTDEGLEAAGFTKLEKDQEPTKFYYSIDKMELYCPYCGNVVMVY